jgi:hypothetical protein
MKKFNLNDHIYIQINNPGWKYLKETVGDDYIKHCIKSPHYAKEINGEIWHKLQVHQVFSILPIQPGAVQFFSLNVLIDDDELK